MFNPQSLSTYVQKIGGLEKLEKNKLMKQPVRSPLPSTSQGKPFRSGKQRSNQIERKYSAAKQKFGDSSAKRKEGGKENRGRRSGYKQR